MGWRRWRGARSALPGNRWDPPFPSEPVAPTAAPPAWQRQTGRRFPTVALRVGQRWDAPYPTAAAAPPEQPATFLATRRRLGLPPPRGQRWDAPPPPTGPPPAWQHQAGRRFLGAAVRRGRTWGAPSPFVWAVNPGTWTPTWNATRWRWRALPVVRGSRWETPPPAAAPAPSPWTVQGVGRRARWLPPPVRGNRWDPPWPFTPAALPSFVPRLLQAAHRPPALPSRRSRTWTAPSPTTGPPVRFICARRRLPPVAAPRGRRTMPPPPFVWAVNPGVWRPGPVGQRRRLWALPVRRGHTWVPQPTPPPPITTPVPRWLEGTPAGIGGDGVPTATGMDATGRATGLEGVPGSPGGLEGGAGSTGLEGTGGL